jgi:hypothetical protein
MIKAGQLKLDARAQRVRQDLEAAGLGGDQLDTNEDSGDAAVA